MDVRNIIFDFGGVLLDWNPRFLYRDLFETEEEMEYFLREICSPEWNYELDKGRPFDEAVAELKELHHEYAEMIRMYRDGWHKMLRSEFPETVALMRSLKEAGYRIYGLTNWSGETFPTAYERYEFLHEFDGIVVSGVEKVAKPDEKIYRILLERYSLRPEASVFIDDNAQNVAAAEELGIHGIRFDNVKSVEMCLRELGVKI